MSLAEARKRAAEARLRLTMASTRSRTQAQRAYKRLDPPSDDVQAGRRRLRRGEPCGWKNAKHAKQWASTFDVTTAAINDLAVSAIDTGLVLSVLEPIWTQEAGNRSARAGRVEAVLDWARFADFATAKIPPAGAAISIISCRRSRELHRSSISTPCLTTRYLRLWPSCGLRKGHGPRA